MSKRTSSMMAVRGDRALIRALDNIDKKVKRRISKAAVSKAATPVVRSLRKNVPRDTGTMRKAVGKRIKTYGSGGRVVAVIGVRQMPAVVDGRLIDPTNVFHFVELGFNHVGGVRVPGTAPLRRAWQANLHTSKRIIRETVWSGIRKEAMRSKK